MAEPLVTVVVLNWNGAHLLADCLRGLAAQDLPEGQVAVWVVPHGGAAIGARLRRLIHW